MAARDIYEAGFDEENGKAINANECPECSESIITDGGEIRCGACGLIVNEYWFDHSNERYSARLGHGDGERTGAPLTPARHDRGISSEIGRWVDGKGNSLPHSKRQKFGRLRTQNNRGRWRSRAERNLSHGFGEITRISGALDLPRSIRDRACTLFRTAQRESLLLGRSIEAVATASVYAACRSGGCLRTIDDLLSVTECSRSGLLNAYRVLNEKLGVASVPTNIGDYVSKFASSCSVPGRVHERARELATIAEETGIANGRKPSGVAAACLYTAGRECGVRLTQTELSETANVSEITIRERHYELLDEVSDAETM